MWLRLQGTLTNNVVFTDSDIRIWTYLLGATFQLTIVKVLSSWFLWRHTLLVSFSVSLSLSLSYLALPSLPGPTLFQGPWLRAPCVDDYSRFLYLVMPLLLMHKQATCVTIWVLQRRSHLMCPVWRHHPLYLESPSPQEKSALHVGSLAQWAAPPLTQLLVPESSRYLPRLVSRISSTHQKSLK